MYEFKVQFYYNHEPVKDGLLILAADTIGIAINDLQDIIHDGNAPKRYDYWSIVF